MVNNNSKLLVLLFIIILQACHEQKPPPKITVTPNKDTSVTAKADAINEKEWIKGDIDTALYNNLSYWDTTISHASSQGYKDTFSVAGASFRLIHNDTTFDGMLEKFENGDWVVQWIAQVLGNHNDYDRTYDLNGDGYKDFIFYWKWFGEVHLFDPSKKTFSDTVNCQIERNWWLLDSARNIFYEVIQGKLMSGTVESNLFTFNKFKRIDLLSLDLNYDRDADDDIITGGMLKDTANHIITRDVKPTKKTDVTEFDYYTFWKKQYKYLSALR